MAHPKQHHISINDWENYFTSEIIGLSIVQEFDKLQIMQPNVYGCKCTSDDWKQTNLNQNCFYPPIYFPMSVLLSYTVTPHHTYISLTILIFYTELYILNRKFVSEAGNNLTHPRRRSRHGAGKLGNDSWICLDDNWERSESFFALCCSCGNSYINRISCRNMSRPTNILHLRS